MMWSARARPMAVALRWLVSYVMGVWHSEYTGGEIQ